MAYTYPIIRRYVDSRRGSGGGGGGGCLPFLLIILVLFAIFVWFNFYMGWIVYVGS